MIILSVEPALALGVLSGLDTTLTVGIQQGVRPLLHADYRLAVHTLGFPDEPEQSSLCHEILTEFGFDCQTFPAWAIQGLVTVVGLAGNTLRLHRPFFLAEPIYDILPPCVELGEWEGWLWLARQKPHQMALHWALQNDGN